jgi:electron transport complex protein RnfC
MKTFTGGVHPPYEKITGENKIEIAKIPKRVIIPLNQHTGAPCKPLVKVGDKVKVGQKVAESDAFISAPVHASISGTITKISEQSHPVCEKFLAIVIESDGKDEWHKSVVKKRRNVDNLSREKILEIVKEAGIVGMGGAGFPTHVKLRCPEGRKIDTVILNGAECEPYLTCDDRLMQEKTKEIIKGLKLIMKVTQAERAFIGVEDNKKDAIASLESGIESEENIKVISLKTKYPQGAEKMLIYIITGKKVPPGKLPLNVGVVVNNVGTSKAVYDAVYESKPLIERVITVTGAVKEPKNLLARIGTPFKNLIEEECGGYKRGIYKVISGGPLMGIAQATDKVPVIKGTTGILVFDHSKEEEIKERPCIRCSKCVDSCPMFLLPTTITKFADKGMFDLCEEYNALDCFECGCCGFVCPSNIPLVEKIKYAKQRICEAKTKKK